jgi:hypothetical protein
VEKWRGRFEVFLRLKFGPAHKRVELSLTALRDVRSYAEDLTTLHTQFP